MTPKKETVNSVIRKCNYIMAGRLCLTEQDFKPNTTFRDLGADSLDALDMVTDVKDEFAINVPANVNFTYDTTLGAALEFITKELVAKSQITPKEKQMILQHYNKNNQKQR